MISISRTWISAALLVYVNGFSETIKPMYKEIVIPKSGFRNIAEESSACPISFGDTTVWVGTSGKAKIFVRDCLYSGSGHGHSVAIGIGDSLTHVPSRGVYLNTETTGWRTMQQFNGGGLPWLLDVNGDGASELIIWQSFSDGKYYSTGTNGLIPFVYTLKRDVFVVDVKSTISMIDQVLKNYKKTIIDQKKEMGKSWNQEGLYNRLMNRLHETKSKLLKQSRCRNNNAEIFHAASDNEMQDIYKETVVLDDSHRCIHVHPKHMRTMIAEKYFKVGGTVFIHSYKEDAPKGFTVPPNVEPPYIVHFYPKSRRILVCALGEKRV